MKTVVGYVVRHIGCSRKRCYASGPPCKSKSGDEAFSPERAAAWVWTNQRDACDWVDERGRVLALDEATKAKWYRIIPIVRLS